VAADPAAGLPCRWYTGAVTPDEVGPAILLGHVDGNDPPVFFRLPDLTTASYETAGPSDERHSVADPES